MRNKKLFIQCVRKAGIRIEEHSIVKVTDFRKVSLFLTLLMDEEVMMEMVMSCLTRSGNVEIVPDNYEPYHIIMRERELGCVDCFKFKSLIILNTDLEDPMSSPEMFLESDVDTEWLRSVPERLRCSEDESENNGRYIGVRVPSQAEKVIYDKENVSYYIELLKKYTTGQHVNVPKMIKFIRNTRREILAYIYIPECLDRHDGTGIVTRYNKCTSDDLVKLFSKDYKLIQD